MASRHLETRHHNTKYTNVNVVHEHYPLGPPCSVLRTSLHRCAAKARNQGGVGSALVAECALKPVSDAVLPVKGSLLARLSRLHHPYGFQVTTPYG